MFSDIFLNENFLVMLPIGEFDINFNINQTGL